MRFTFIHAADLHLDTPFEGITRVSPELAEVLRDASLKAFDRIVELAIERQAAFVLFAGDIYDGEDRGVRAQLRFLRGVERLSREGIATLVCHGNHDPLGGWSAIRHWPDNVKIFGSSEVEAVPISWRGEVVARVYGLSYDRREVRENLTLRFLALPELAGGAAERRELWIGMLHCTVGQQPEHAPYSPCSLEDMRKVAVDYWALGHIHRHDVLSSGSQWTVYPGNTQGRSPKPSETGAKGVVVVTCEDNRVLGIEHVATDVVRFATLSLDVAELAESCDLGDLQKALIRRADQLLSENQGRALILRVFLSGRNELYHALNRPGAVEQLLRDLREESASEGGQVWWESLVNKTRPPRDISSLEGRTDFLGALVEQWKRARENADQLTALKEQVLSSVPSQFLRRLDDMQEEKLTELLDEATYAVLDALQAVEQ
ncbi:MAG: DNA repair exonuclease [Thermoleophilia bacterium]|nr:DNA repair exonuclease [Thermoleophilia bacterium]